MKQVCILLLMSCMQLHHGYPQQKNSAPSKQTIKTDWPETMPWWKGNNLRVIQVNLPAYEATLNVDSLVADLQYFSANTLIINAGGIMAFYPSKLPFHYINPYMKGNMLSDVISKCHQNGIRVIVRFDFSKAHRSVFEAHPEWFYISPKGERMINEDMYAVSINAGYEQDYLFKIVEEVLTLYEIDGLFMNMPGYQTRNSYLGKYHGIDQNESEKKRFFEFSGGMKLPVEENKDDIVFQKYEAFKKFTTDELMERLHKLVKTKSAQIAICTYMDKYVDIIRHESQTSGLPYWPYMSSDNVSNALNSYPDHIVSNASMQQISFQSRYNAIEPEEASIRLYENIANGSGLDISLMGDFRDYEDERNYGVFKSIYAHHKNFEPYFGKYSPVAHIAVIAPGAWPGGDASHEYRGIQLMLKEAHLQFDIIEARQIAHREEAIKKYRLIILPEITYLDLNCVEVLRKASLAGTHLIATNRTLFDNPEALYALFGAKTVKQNNDGSGFYLQVPADTENKIMFKRLEEQKLLFLKFNMGFYDLTGASRVFLPLLTPGRPGPPEIIGGHAPTGYYAMGIKDHAKSKAVLLPINLGRMYYLLGYQQHKNILLDVIDSVFPEAHQQLETNAHPRVEVILQNYAKNTPSNVGKSSMDGMILHLVNLTGFSGNTYFKPVPLDNIQFRIKSDFKPSRMFSMVRERPVDFSWESGYVRFTLDRLDRYESIVMDK